MKSKNHNVQPAVLEVLLSLKLKDVNLDNEKEEELKKKKMNSKKHNILRLSKRERKVYLLSIGILSVLYKFKLIKLTAHKYPRKIGQI